MRDEDEINHAINVVLASPTANFTTLVRLAGLDPARSFRFAVLSGVDFFNQNLSQFDFQGADLSGCSFREARIRGANFSGARVERRSLREAADWKAFRVAETKEARRVTLKDTKPLTPQLTFEQALNRFHKLLSSGRRLKPETMAAMMDAAPSFDEGAAVLELILRFRQDLSQNVVRGFAAKVHESIANEWLTRMAEQNLGTIRHRTESLKVFVAVEASNLLGSLGDDTLGRSFNRMLIESTRPEEVLSILKYFENREWKLSGRTIQYVSKLFEDNLPIEDVMMPPPSYRAPRFSKRKSGEFED